MNTYSINYHKVYSGYTKISRCIESVETEEQLSCIQNLVESWVNLIDKYCDEVYHDRSNRNRKKDADKLAEAGVNMFNTLKEHYQQQLQAFNEDDYEGAFKPTQIMSMQDISHMYDMIDKMNEESNEKE